MNTLYEVLNWMLIVVVLVFVARELYIAHRGGRLGMLLDSLSASTKEALSAWARIRELCEVLAPVLGREDMSPEELMKHLANRVAELDAALLRWQVIGHDPQSLLAEQARHIAELTRTKESLERCIKFIDAEARGHELHGPDVLARRYREFTKNIKEKDHA